MAGKAAEDQETYNRRPPSKRGIWNSALPDWDFGNEGSLFYPEDRSSCQGVSRTDLGAETSCAVPQNFETMSKTTSNASIACPSSTGPEALSTELNCSTDYHFLTTASGAGISASSVAEISMRNSSKPSNDAVLPPSLCNLTVAEMIPRDAGDDCTSASMIPASIKVLDAGLISDRTFGLCEEHSPQHDPIADSQPLTSAIEVQNRERDNVSADLEASTSALIVPPLLEVSGQIENPSISKGESVSDCQLYSLI